MRETKHLPPLLSQTSTYHTNPPVLDNMGAAISAVVMAVLPPVIIGLVNLFRDNKPEPNPVVSQIKEAIQQPSAYVQGRWPFAMTPERWPTAEEFDSAMKRIQDQGGNEERLHFGISGVVKSGKSSLLNSFRGLTPRDHGAAGVGPSEKTRYITPYADPRSDYPFVWYDIAGFDTKSAPADNYFNQHGLFALDCILILIKDSFRKSDAAMIKQCRNLSIPTYIVRSFSDHHIRNIEDDTGDSYEDARAEYIRDAEKNVREGLADFQLGGQRLYLVNRQVMLAVVGGRSKPDGMIHEAELLEDVLQECQKRRLPKVPKVQ